MSMKIIDSPAIIGQSVPAEVEALKALRFYRENYTQTLFEGLGPRKKKLVLGTKPSKCRFCDGEPPTRTFKKEAHTVSEFLGNKYIVSLYECDVCNKRFSTFEDDLAKMTLPFRTMGGVMGKKNHVPTLISATGEVVGKSRVEFNNGTLHMSHIAGDDSFAVDDLKKTITFSYVVQSHRPLGAFKALCKSAFSLIPDEELVYFNELKKWLLEEDLTTGLVYKSQSHFCYRSFVPAYKPFPQPIVALLRRGKQIDAPYMTMFIAFGNISYQIFLPCPARDEHLRKKNISIPLFPHLYQLKPWMVKAPVSCTSLDLNDCERTNSETRTVRWSYEKREKVG